jgi:hypothetical protein
MVFKIERVFKTKVLFECSVAVGGSSYLLIYGEHINGNFCCVPNYKWGCEMSEPEAVKYNALKLEECGANKNVALSLATAIKQMSEREHGNADVNVVQA